MEYVKEDYLLGNKKIIVGDKLHDLVLENLGRIYIRYGNSYKEFNNLMSSINKASSSKESITITDSLADVSEYTSGTFVYDSTSGTLYLVYNGEFLILAEHINTNDSKYVLKTGDTMTGQLVINTSKAPLIVKSTDLVSNLNANYIEGYSANVLAKKEVDETISGNWIFTGENTFQNQTRFENTAIFNQSEGDAAIRIGSGALITDGSMGSSVFSSGMTGYGWRLDAETNTLEIDNLIVRGVLNVFELVVNKVSATNGSLWITDSFKINKIDEIKFINCAKFTLNDLNSLSENEYYIPYQYNADESYSLDKGFDYIFNLTSKNNCCQITLDMTNHPLASKTSLNDIDSPKYIKFYFLFKIVDKTQFINYINAVGVEMLSSYSIMSQLAALNVIDKINIYQKYTESLSDYETVTYGEYTKQIVPIDKEFDTQLFTTVAGEYTKLDSVDTLQYTDTSKLCRINLYYKYFGESFNTTDNKANNLYIVESEEGEYPALRPGDIIKCQKFTGQSIKQYHAIVLGNVDAYGILIELQNSSILSNKTSYTYDSNGKLVETNADGKIVGSSHENLDKTLYSGSPELNKNLGNKSLEEYDDNSESIAKLTAGIPEKDDALVRIGSIMSGDRRNSLLLTSSENNSPFEDVLVNVNRPDYSIIYCTPKYKTFTAQYKTTDNTYVTKPFYLQGKNSQGIYFSDIIKIGDILADESKTWDDVPSDLQNIFTSESRYSTEFKSIYDKYRAYTVAYEVPVASGVDGEEELTNVKKYVDVNLTYQINSDEPVYYDSDGNRIKKTLKEQDTGGEVEVSYFTSSNTEAKVITPLRISQSQTLDYTPDGETTRVTLSLGQII